MWAYDVDCFMRGADRLTSNAKLRDGKLLTEIVAGRGFCPKATRTRFLSGNALFTLAESIVKT